MVPTDVSAAVISNQPLSSHYNVLALTAPAIAQSAAPGQFVMVKARPGHDPILRRPFSIFEILRDSQGVAKGFSLLNKSIGVSTRALYAARPGDAVACLGPLGQPFATVDPPTDAWMVAGGVGLAPFGALAEALGRRGVRTTLFYGARRGDELFWLARFRDLGVDLVLATEDGSVGDRGRIVDPLERRLAAHPAARPLMIYACGPEGMLAATAAVAARFGRPCQVSVERVMGCGLGGCYSCVVRLRNAHGGFHHARACLVGPVLPGDRLLWD